MDCSEDVMYCKGNVLGVLGSGVADVYGFAEQQVRDCHFCWQGCNI